jgi:hypothetical protein
MSFAGLMIFQVLAHRLLVVGRWTLMESLILAQDERWRRA